MTMVSLPDALAPFIAAARNIVARSHDYPERVMSTGGLGNPADLLATDFHRLALAFDAQEGAAAAAAAVDHETLVDHLTRELGDAYDCTRVWSAWNVNTMTEEDFEPVTDRIDEIAAGILALGPIPDRIPVFTSTDSWVLKARGLEIFTGRCPWSDCDRKTSAGRLVVHDGAVKVVVGIEAYAKVSEPREGEIIGLALAPYPPRPIAAPSDQADDLVAEFVSFARYLAYDPARPPLEKREVSVRMIRAVAAALVSAPVQS